MKHAPCYQPIYQQPKALKNRDRHVKISVYIDPIWLHLNAMTEEHKEVVRRLGPGRSLHRIIPILDASGKVIHRVVKPLMVEVRARDVVQVIVGASILAIPAGFTEETWNLGEQLPVANIIAAPFNALMAEKIESHLTGVPISSDISFARMALDAIGSNCASWFTSCCGRWGFSWSA